MSASESGVTPQPTCSILLCPLDDCGWQHREEMPDVPEGTLRTITRLKAALARREGDPL